MTSVYERTEFSTRLKQALTNVNIDKESPTQLARAFNSRCTAENIKPVTIHAARKWLVGEAIPTQDKVRIVAEMTGCNLYWLRFGNEEPQFKEPVRSPIQTRISDRLQRMSERDLALVDVMTKAMTMDQ